MTIKAKDIKGLLGEEKKAIKPCKRCRLTQDCPCLMCNKFNRYKKFRGYNQHRQEIAKKELGFDIGKLLQILASVYVHPKLMTRTAQALIENEHKLIVVKG